MKKILHFAIVFCAFALVLWVDNAKNKKIPETAEEIVEDVQYVKDPEGKWVKYALFEENPDYDPNEDDSSTTEYLFNKYMKDKYCYASYAPHGDLWNDRCFDSESECNQSLQEELKEGMYLNEHKCYKPYLLKAWCVSSVVSGYRYYDGDTYGEMLDTVCVEDKNVCDQVQKYVQKDSKAICHQETVLSHETEGGYLWKTEKVQNLIKRNNKLKPLVFKKVSK